MDNRVIVVTLGSHVLRVFDNRDSYDEWMEKCTYSEDELDVVSAKVYGRDR